MKFKIIGTKTTLEPKDPFVIKSMATRPDKYEPTDAEAKKAAAEAKGEPDEVGAE